MVKIPEHLMPEVIGEPPEPPDVIDADALRQMEREIAAIQLEREKDRKMSNPPIPMAKEPAPPYKYSPPTAGDTGMDIKFNGQKLVVSATVMTSVEAKHLIGALTALVPFLPDNGKPT